MQRRTALRLMGAAAFAGGGYAAVKTLDGVFSLGGAGGSKGRLVSRTRTGMGTLVSLSLVDGSEDRAETAIADAFAQMDRLETLLTRFDAASPVGELNRTGKISDAPVELMETVALAARAHSATNGDFDPTVAPLLDLYVTSLAQGNTPTGSEVSERMELVGMDKIRAAGRSIELTREGMAVTLDGVAKGYVVDAMAASLSASGIRNALINAGGDIRAIGGRGAGRAWKIAVRDPRDASGVVETFDLTDGACATSGDYEIFFDSERMFHHVIDPHTGASPHGVSSATVLAQSAGMSDALSTALMVAGGESAARARALAPLARRVLLLGADGTRIVG